MISWIGCLERFQQKIEKALLLLGGGISIFVMLLVAIDVFLRKFFNSPIAGSYEVVQILTVGMVFLGVAYVQSVKGHIFIEVATDRLPGKVQAGLNFFGYLIGLVICSILTWQTGLSAWKALLTMEYAIGVVEIPLWPARLVVAIGMGLLTLRIFWDILFYLFPILNPKTQHREGEGVWL